MPPRATRTVHVRAVASFSNPPEPKMLELGFYQQSHASQSKPLTVVEPDTLQKLRRSQCGVCYDLSDEVRLPCAHMHQDGHFIVPSVTICYDCYASLAVHQAGGRPCVRCPFCRHECVMWPGKKCMDFFSGGITANCTWVPRQPRRSTGTA